MIPTMIVFGLIFGWWWRPTLVAAAIVWPTLLLVTGVPTLSWQLPLTLAAAAALGAVNAGVGVAVDQGILWSVRRLRDSSLVAGSD